MNLKARLALLLLTAALTATVILCYSAWSGSGAGARAVDQAAPPQPPAPPAAADLHIRVAASEEKPENLLGPAAAAWKDAAPTNILLNRTPRVYQIEPPFTGKIPALEARALRAKDNLVVRLEWDDATRNVPEAPPAKTGEGGDPEKLYKRPTAETSQFADAAAVMVPENGTGPDFPSLQMGDAKKPVRLYYWNASRGAEELAASGRTTTTSTGRAVPYQAEYADGRWCLTLQLPDRQDGTPAAFAVWDGASNDRDGLKFFSIWYVLSSK